MGSVPTEYGVWKATSGDISVTGYSFITHPSSHPPCTSFLNIRLETLLLVFFLYLFLLILLLGVDMGLCRDLSITNKSKFLDLINVRTVHENHTSHCTHEAHKEKYCIKYRTQKMTVCL